MSTSHPDGIQLAGAPKALGVGGLYFLVDSSKTGDQRIWRNEAGGRIYFDNGWNIGDVLNKNVVYYQEMADTLGNYQADPWLVSNENWHPTVVDYSATLVLTRCEDTSITKSDSSTSEPIYTLTYDETIKATRTYYTHQYYTYTTPEDKNNVYTSPTFYQVEKISRGAKVPENKFYRIGSTGVPFLACTETEDTYFEDSKTYYTCPEENTFVKAVFIESAVPAKTYYVLSGTRQIRTIKVLDAREDANNPITRIEKVEVRDQIKEVDLDLRTRYIGPELEVGHIYRFAFVKDFKYLGYMPPSEEDYTYTEEEKEYNDSDVTRGIFKVDNITNYADIILSGIDVYQNLYLPLSIPQEVYEKDRKTWMNTDTWYKLVDPVLAPRIFYVPAAIINGIPDANVTGFDRLQLIVDIGVFNNAELLTDLVTTVNMIMKARYGITGVAELASYDKVYIPNMYYRWLEKQREQNKKKFMEQHKEQYFNTVCAEEYNQWISENKELRQLLQAYEDNLTGATANG